MGACLPQDARRAGILGALRALPFSLADLNAVLAPLGEARPLPPRACWDEGVFAIEQDAIFGRSWMCVGREDEVGKPGQWLLAPVTPEGVVVVRGADLALYAFYNVCRHRASTLVAEPCGRAAQNRVPLPWLGVRAHGRAPRGARRGGELRSRARTASCP